MLLRVSAKVKLIRDMGEEEAALSMDATVDGAVLLSDERVDRVDCDRVDAVVEFVLDTEGVYKTVAVLDDGFPLFGVDTEHKTDGGFFRLSPDDDWKHD